MKNAYVCAPLAGDVDANIIRARGYCRQLVAVGFCPISTHLAFDGVFDDSIPAEREAAIQAGITLMMNCEVLVIFGSHGNCIITDGMAREIQAAHDYDIPVVYGAGKIQFEKLFGSPPYVSAYDTD